jgi:hypothetical protein
MGSVALADSSVHALDGNTASIARWYNNKEAAVSLRFDDSLESHVKIVIPTLNKYGIKATFMVNPGMNRYLKYKDFWENDVPRMGHELGNHTMNHRGATTVQEAEYEIGETTRLIRRLYPNQSSLMVFASGGGRKCLWGGERWDSAVAGYKELVPKYNLIDLYDGKHPAITAQADNPSDHLEQKVNEAIRGNFHQAFLFHKIGNPALYDKLKALYMGHDITYRENQFVKFISYLNALQNRLWIATLLEILKYEYEYNNSSIKFTGGNGKCSEYMFTVAARELYDQELTINIRLGKTDISGIYQNDTQIKTYSLVNGKLSFNVKPKNSKIIIMY